MDTPPEDLSRTVARALEEDVGTGDLTAALVPADRDTRATVITREPAVVCGRPWFDEVFRQLGARVAVEWRTGEGDSVGTDTLLCRLAGPARALSPAPRPV